MHFREKRRLWELFRRNEQWFNNLGTVLEHTSVDSSTIKALEHSTASRALKFSRVLEATVSCSKTVLSTLNEGGIPKQATYLSRRH